MSIHFSSIKAAWKGSFNGLGRIEGSGLSQTVSLPKEFHGLGEGVSPEDLLLSALASCYLITLGIILEKGGLEYEDLSADAQLQTEVQPKPAIREAILRVRVISNAETQLITEAAEKAKTFCLIARAVEGNISKRVEVEIVTPQDRRLGY